MIDRACISLNNNCNLKCKYCHFEDKQYNFNSFDYNSIRIIIDNIHSYCIENNIKKFKLGFVSAGETMLKMNIILEILKYIKEKNMQELCLYTITNGTLFTKENLVKFKEFDNIIKICFSLDGYQEIHNAGRMYYSKVMESIELYKQIFEKSPAINCTVNILSYQNKKQLIDFFINNNLLDVTFSKLVGYIDKDLYISDIQYNEFLQYVKDTNIQTRQFKKEKCYDCTMYGKLCGVGRTNIFITPEGIYPCGRFYKNENYNLGNFYDCLSLVEKQVSKLIPVDDFECYYIKNIENK